MYVLGIGAANVDVHGMSRAAIVKIGRASCRERVSSPV